jgi:hypothetical protein
MSKSGRSFSRVEGQQPGAVIRGESPCSGILGRSPNGKHFAGFWGQEWIVPARLFGGKTRRIWFVHGEENVNVNCPHAIEGLRGLRTGEYVGGLRDINMEDPIFLVGLRTVLALFLLLGCHCACRRNVDFISCGRPHGHPGHVCPACPGAIPDHCVAG